MTERGNNRPRGTIPSRPSRQNLLRRQSQVQSQSQSSSPSQPPSAPDLTTALALPPQGAGGEGRDTSRVLQPQNVAAGRGQSVASSMRAQDPTRAFQPQNVAAVNAQSDARQTSGGYTPTVNSSNDQARERGRKRGRGRGRGRGGHTASRAPPVSRSIVRLCVECILARRFWKYEINNSTWNANYCTQCSAALMYLDLDEGLTTLDELFARRAIRSSVTNDASPPRKKLKTDEDYGTRSSEPQIDLSSEDNLRMQSAYKAEDTQKAEQPLIEKEDDSMKPLLRILAMVNESNIKQKDEQLVDDDEDNPTKALIQHLAMSEENRIKQEDDGTSDF